MADKKVSDLPSLNGADVDAADLLYIVDSSAGAAGSKKITVGQYQLAPVSGGTANTVVYLNGSKVESSSSALTFDGTNLGIGTSSPGEKLAVSQGNIYALRTGGAKLRLADQNNEVSVESSPTGVVSNMVFKTSATTQMTLDSSGNLGIGTSSPGVKLEVAGDARLTGANPSLSAVPTSTGFFIDNRSVGKSTVFRVSSASAIDTTAATIDASGNLLVGDTNGGLQNSYSTNFTQASGYWTVNHANGSPDTRRYFYFGYNGTEIGSITQNGTTGVLFNQTSDRRLKDNIVPAPSASDVIDAIEIVSHDWKSAPDEHVTYGVIAQDLALVAPQAVLQGDSGDEIEKTWGVDYSKLVPMLIKEIQSLRARVAALEAK